MKNLVNAKMDFFEKKTVPYTEVRIQSHNDKLRNTVQEGIIDGNYGSRRVSWISPRVKSARIDED